MTERQRDLWICAIGRTPFATEAEQARRKGAGWSRWADRAAHACAAMGVGFNAYHAELSAAHEIGLDPWGAVAEVEELVAEIS